MTGLTLLLSACVAAVVILAFSRLGRAEWWGAALFVVVVGCVGLGGFFAAGQLAGPLGDGRALAPCAVGPLLALSLRSGLLGRLSGPLIGGAGTILLVGGLGGHAAVLAGLPVAGVAVPIALALAGVAATVATVVSLRRAFAWPSTLMRSRGVGEALGVAFVGAGAVMAAGELALDVAPTTRWAGLVGLGALVSVTTRTAATPLSLRDATLALGAAFMARVVAAGAGDDVMVAAAMGLVAIHGLWPVGVLPPRRFRPAAMTGDVPTRSTLQGVPPLLDDGAMRPSLRPRVLARTPARRLVDAAVERAWRSSPGGRGRAPVDVVGGDDVDVDGDAGELAEALSAVLDGALRAVRPGDGRVTITVRAAPQSISFEVDDVGVDPDARPFLDRPVGDRDDALGLARARILIERHGGQLHLRRGERGAVHLTLPRRLQRGPVGVA